MFHGGETGFAGAETLVLGPLWNLDLWFQAPEPFYGNRARLEAEMARMTPVIADRVVEAKRWLMEIGAYNKVIGSVDVYSAFLDDGVENMDAFRSWLRKRTAGEGEVPA